MLAISTGVPEASGEADDEGILVAEVGEFESGVAVGRLSEPVAVAETVELRVCEGTSNASEVAVVAGPP